MTYSIIVPCFNVSKYIVEGLQSCLEQSVSEGDELELVLINDGSLDDTRAKIIDLLDKNKDDNFKDSYNKNIKEIIVITQKNGGLSSARNTGIEFIKNTILRDFLDYIFTNKKEDNLRAEAEIYFNNEEYLTSFCQEFGLDFAYIKENKNAFLKLIEQIKIIRNDKYKELELDLNNILDFIRQDLPNQNIIHFFDSDDILHSECMKKSSENIKQYGLDLFWHGYFAFPDGHPAALFSHRQSGLPANLMLHLQNATANGALSGVDLMAFYNAYEMADLNKMVLSWAWRGAFRADLLNKNKKYLRFDFAIEAEDILFGNLLILYAQKIKVSWQSLLFYRVRANSISTAFNNNSNLAFYIEKIKTNFKNNTEAKRYYWQYSHLKAAHDIWKVLEKDTLINFRFIPVQTKRIIMHILKNFIIMGFKSARHKKDPLGARALLKEVEVLITALAPLRYRLQLKTPLALERAWLFFYYPYLRAKKYCLAYLKKLLS